MKYRQLRTMLEEQPKYPGCRRVQRAPLLTPGFPGSFNMSSTEHHWLREYGGYIGWDHDYVFSTVQTCIRPNDFALLGTDRGRWHLGVFEMADLGGEVALAERPDYARLHGAQLRDLVGFLGRLGIAADRIHVSYCVGGPVAELTGGAYTFDYTIPPDTLSRSALLDAGIPETNLIADRTRDTLLSLHVHRPSPWGYRNEVYVDVGNDGRRHLVDVATEEYFLWAPVFADGGTSRADIIGLKELDAGAVGVGVGVERLCAVVNDLPRTDDVDYLQPFYAALRDVLGAAAGGETELVGESLRALHRVYTDMHHHDEARVERSAGGEIRMSTKRRKKAAAWKRNVARRLSARQVEMLLAQHAETQPWHTHLAGGIAPTVEAIDRYRRSPARSLVDDG